MILFLIVFANLFTHLYVHSNIFLYIELLNYDSNNDFKKEKIQLSINSR